ncbi:TPA: translation initiation factor IF-2 [Candidatus Uhrbacteria bacterium]|uniref:Translation initiation factor IF-2 n=2 Tax=Candidatus Uhriibacteriota TaxID=1752732 RepID=A0A0G1Q6W7_9BACT|nr:MAG: Translation initiation factor IF-2 [Candidatus Uhrbacteria bacterium GW2011_GWF2_46_218]KKU40734.1 MAG: Translation initiation factor IF-2 [Candidatus Uhrbacteria bacterium GW2011_GWE2_46_68]HBK33582.1 translation initiation factor IF-2 [Candidatus Uhrbacteria bacterium]HCB19703.1 translation initiation factor IF-2 [Candidatus Uhrbacteria bacterium]
MNITELARRLRVNPEEIRQKLPELGLSIGRRAIKIDNRQAQRIMEAWSEMRRRERLAQKVELQKASQLKKYHEDGEEQVIISLPAVITVRDFASRLNLPVPRLMQELMKNGILASLNERIDFNTASIIAEDIGFKAKLEEKGKEEDDTQSVDRVRAAVEGEKVESLQNRPPVIVVMGHVDHGKTKLLDAIRNTHVMETEAGGITQHIGAYQVVRKGQPMTFIDTPGHEAFTVMRSRGAKVADMAILVVAADDGVQPQTKEAINIIKSAGLPFLVAINKIDREGANVDRVKGQLAELQITSEDWGGKSVMVPISAKQGLHIDDLLDMILLVYDMEKEKIKSNPNRRAIGTVIESHVDTGAGPVATVLVQSGTLHVGETLGVRDILYGRVRAMLDWKGEQMKEAPPSTPVQIIGWKLSPAVGDIMEVPQDATVLKKIKSTDSSHKATEEMASLKKVSTESTEETGKKYLNLLIRTDVLGSLEAILGMLDRLEHEDVGVKVVQRGLGNITESDIASAEADHSLVIGFNVVPTPTAEEMARDKGVEIVQFQIIYKLFEDVLDRLQKLLPSETTITEIGKLEVLANFRHLDRGWIVGGRVKEGKILPKAKVRLSRGDVYVGEGEVETLQIGRSEIKEARQGQECGMNYVGKVKPEIGDVMEIYMEEKKAKKLEIRGVSKR